MLDTFRKHSRSWGIYLTFGAIILIFAVGFGAVSPDKACGGAGSGKNAKYAEVADDRIDAGLLALADDVSADFPSPRDPRSMQLDMYKATRYVGLRLSSPFSGSLYERDPELASPVKLIKVMDDLIETKLVAGYAKSLGMTVSNEEMNERLAGFLKGFTDDKTGKFESAGFQQWLGRIGVNSATFENFVKDEILREKVIQALVGELAPTDAELVAQHNLESETVKLEIVSVDKGSARPLVLVTDQEVTDWLAKNDQKVKDVYESRKATEFTTPKKLKVRGIKIIAANAKEAADDEQKKEFETERAAAKTKAQDVLKDLQTKLAAAPAPAPTPTPAPDAPPTPDPVPAPLVDPYALFAEVAKASSDDTESKEAGGLLGDGIPLPELGRRPYNPAVKTALEAAKNGVPTDVLETDDAFWIFMVENATPEVVTSYDDAKTKIAKRLLQEERVDGVKQKLADELFANAKADPTKKLADLVKDLNTKYQADEGKGLMARETTPFPRLKDGESPQITGGVFDKAPAIVRAAFAANVESPLLPQVFSIGSGESLVVARFLEKTPAKPLEDKEKETLKRQLGALRKRAAYRGWYEDYLAKAQTAGDAKLTDTFLEEKKKAEEAYVQAGGLLPGMTPPAAAPGAQGIKLTPGGPGAMKVIPVQPPK